MKENKLDQLVKAGGSQLANYDFSKQKQLIHDKGESFGNVLSKAIDNLVDFLFRK